MQLIDNANDAFESKLEECCPEDGIEFNARDFERMLQPAVYLVLGPKDKPLYIGSSCRGLRRMGDPGHQKIKAALVMGSKVLMYPTETTEQARKLETLLIKSLRPLFNGHHEAFKS